MRTIILARLPHVGAFLAVAFFAGFLPRQIDVLIGVVLIALGISLLHVFQQTVARVNQFGYHRLLYLAGGKDEVGFDFVVDGHGLLQPQDDAAGLAVEAQFAAGAHDVVVRLADEHVALGTYVF